MGLLTKQHQRYRPSASQPIETRGKNERCGIASTPTLGSSCSISSDHDDPSCTCHPRFTFQGLRSRLVRGSSLNCSEYLYTKDRQTHESEPTTSLNAARLPLPKDLQRSLRVSRGNSRTHELRRGNRTFGGPGVRTPFRSPSMCPWVYRSVPDPLP